MGEAAPVVVVQDLGVVVLEGRSLVWLMMFGDQNARAVVEWQTLITSSIIITARNFIPSDRDSSQPLELDTKQPDMFGFSEDNHQKIKLSRTEPLLLLLARKQKRRDMRKRENRVVGRDPTFLKIMALHVLVRRCGAPSCREGSTSHLIQVDYQIRRIGQRQFAVISRSMLVVNNFERIVT